MSHAARALPTGGISSILRLNSWAGRVVLIFYGVGTTAVAILNLGALVQPALGILALAMLWAGLALLGFPTGEPLGLGWTLGIVGIVAVASGLGAANLANPDNAGFANWPLGATTFLLFVLALRGRRRFAWIGFAAIAAVSLAVAFLLGHDVAGTINDLARQAATLLIGTLFALVLRRATRTIDAINASQLRLATIAAARDAATRESAALNYRLEQDARPALERIIDPEPFSQTDLWRFAALDESLRESVQLKGFSGDGFSAAVRAARGRGLSVTLFDDRTFELSPAERARVENAFIPLLMDATRGSITARLNPEGGSELATIVVEEDGLFRRVLVASELQVS